MSQDQPPKSEARQRILETADRLFYKDGIRAVGIDRIIAEANVAKMSLYKHFASKDDLVLEVLKHREQRIVDFFQTAIERHQKRKKDKLQAFFAALKDLFESKDFRGCAFQNAAVELADPNHPGANFVREHKRRFSEMLRGIVIESAGKDASHLVPMIVLLVEGAAVTSVVQGNPDAANVAREAAMRLLSIS